MSSILIGFLASFLTWAVIWSLSDRGHSQYGMSGGVTNLTFVPDGPQTPTASDSAEQLQRFVQARSLTLVIASVGDGSPQLTVYNPQDTLPWLPTKVRGEGIPPGGVYLFEDTYSAEVWARSGKSPLVPPGNSIGGTVARPPGVDRLQFAVVDPAGAIPGGRFVISTVDPGEVEEFSRLMSGAGYSLQARTSTPTVAEWARDPLVLLSLLMLVTGIVGSMTYWAVTFGELKSETRVRSQFGGSPMVQVAQYLKRYAAAPLVGVPLGVLASLLVVRTASGLWSDEDATATILGTASVGALLGVLALAGVLSVLVRLHRGVE